MSALFASRVAIPCESLSSCVFLYMAANKPPLKSNEYAVHFSEKLRGLTLGCFETLNFEVKESKKKKLRLLVVAVDNDAFNGAGAQRPRERDEAVRMLHHDDAAGSSAKPFNLTMDETQGGMIHAQKLEDLKEMMARAPFTLVFSRVADSILEYRVVPQLSNKNDGNTNDSAASAAPDLFRQPSLRALDAAGLGWLHDGVYAWIPYSASGGQKRSALWPGRVRHLKSITEGGR